jgi:hypothetical protein
MHELMASVQCTAVSILLIESCISSWYFLLLTYAHFQELYHELHALDRFDQDYRRTNQDEENSTPAPRGATYLHF